MLDRVGAVDISNTVYTIRNGADRLHLAGLDDVYARRNRLKKVLKRLPQDGASILLVHEPDFADISAETGRFDLQISGHTHGGQVVIPFIGAPKLPNIWQEVSGWIVPGERYVPVYKPWGGHGPSTHPDQLPP